VEEFARHAGDYIHTNPWLAVVAVFLGGMITASNPCVLAMIPLMMSFVAGRREQSVGPLKALGYSLTFVLGLSITFTVLGVTAALTGSLYGEVSGVWSWIVAAVCLVMGLHLLGVLPFTIPVPARIQPRTRGAVGAFLLGLLFGVVSAPCAAPILIVLLTYLATSGSSVAYGAVLLLVYGLGHSVLILVAGTSMGAARKLVESRRITRATDVMRRVAGALIVAVGVYFAYLASR
jgi:cytochrome c-type biogenesis protein